MVQETFISPFHLPQAFLPAAAAAPPSAALLSALSFQQQPQQQNFTTTLLQLQPYLAMLLAAANKDRERMETISPIEGDIIKPIALKPQFAMVPAPSSTTVPLVTSPTTFPTATPHTQQDTVAAALSPAKHGSNTSSRNKLGRSYNPGRPLAMEDRIRILDLYEQGHKISHIARQIGVTHSCVSKIMSRFRRTGSMQPRSFAAAQQPAAAAAAATDPAPFLAAAAAPRLPLSQLQAQLLQLQQCSSVYPYEFSRLIKEEDSDDSEHISVDDGETSKCGSPMSRLSISPSSAFSPPVRKNSPTYSIESILNQ